MADSGAGAGAAQELRASALRGAKECPICFGAHAAPVPDVPSASLGGAARHVRGLLARHEPVPVPVVRPGGAGGAGEGPGGPARGLTDAEFLAGVGAGS